MKLYILSLFLIIFCCNFIFAQGQIPLPHNEANIQQNIADAKIFIQNKDFNSAINLLQNSLQNNQENSVLKFWLGKTYYTQGNYQKTVEILTSISEELSLNSAEKAQLIQMLGLSHYILGHLNDAIPFLEKIVVSQPENSEIKYALGVSYIQMRQPEKSRKIYAELFGVEPNSAGAYLLNAQMLIRQQFEETAEIELNKALQLDAKLPQVRQLLGEMAIYRADIDKGISFLREELNLNPANSMAYYRLGEALSRQLKWDEAIVPLQKSIWINPFFSGPYIVLGKVYLKKKDLINAENLLRRSVTLDPRNFGAHHLLAQVLQQQGKTEQAKTEFELAEKLRGANEKAP